MTPCDFCGHNLDRSHTSASNWKVCSECPERKCRKTGWRAFQKPGDPWVPYFQEKIVEVQI